MAGTKDLFYAMPIRPVKFANRSFVPTHDVLYFTQTLALNAGEDSPGEASPATLSSPAVERGVFIVNKLITSNVNTKNFQTPLSGEAEERVPRVALAGESSPPCDLRHSSSFCKVRE
ncbi:hypothetical protein [Mucilaginibacter dorajii]|uniref:hypothetical protein n=1 Tax=Mucilaginibacter dorajii TaxID=692994 RepID=UPI00216A6B22|nr:hypothetical protein [Mucilaginibacter dorajii]MCS3732134.1 hypothetical protein [Mucilaginibacter dorajii]